jgi:chloride channel 3/4/5
LTQYKAKAPAEDGIEWRIMSGAGQREHLPSASSSSHTPVIITPASSDDHDELDFLGDDEDDHDILDNDPIHGDLSTPLSFKRKQKPALLSNPLRVFSTFAGSSSASSSSPPRSHQRPPKHQPSGSLASLASAAGSLREQVFGNATAATSKDGIPNDWYAEGPGRRVRYEDLTAIDWIFEYTKERQRLRVLSSSSGGGIISYIRHLLDASQVWIVLLLTGLAVGVIAALIDITTDWLGDIKLGFCTSGPEGGHFYLNKNFCCYGYDQGSKCAGWRFWSEALGIHSTAGKWFIEYFFFLAFGVCAFPRLPALFLLYTYGYVLTRRLDRSSLPSARHCLYKNMPSMPSTVVSPRLRLSWEDSSFASSWALGH